MNRFAVRAAAWLLAASSTVVLAQSAVPPPQEIVEALKPAASRGVTETRPSLSLAIQFEPNSARVLPASGPMLGNLVAALLMPELKASRFVIEAHGDASGTAQANERLSQQRADEVRLYLVALGVPASRLRAAGQATGDPVPNSAPQLTGAERRAVRVVAHD